MTTDVDEYMRESVRALYDVFASYPLRSKIDGCPCCVKESMQLALHTRPLRDLRGDDLRRFAGKSMTTWGDRDDFRHFLPRLLELLASGELGCDPQIVLGKLAHADWNTWPAPERAGVASFLMAWWRRVLETDPDVQGADVILLAIARCEATIRSYVATMARTDSIHATRQICHFALSFAPRVLWGASASANSWSLSAGQAAEVAEFLRSPDTVARLEACAVKNAGEPWAQLMMDVATSLIAF